MLFPLIDIAFDDWVLAEYTKAFLSKLQLYVRRTEQHPRTSSNIPKWDPNCCRPRLPKPHCDCPWASVCHWPGQCMGAVNVEIEWKWLKLHVSYIYSNIRNLQFLEPHVFIFTGTIMIPLEWSRQDWIDCALGFMGSSEAYSKILWRWLTTPNIAGPWHQRVREGCWYHEWSLVTPSVICFTKKKGDGTWHKMLTKRSGGWVLRCRGTSTSRSCSMVTSGSLMVSAACQPKTELWATGRFARWKWSEKSRKNIIL